MREMSDEEKREWTRMAVINDARQLIKQRKNLAGVSDTAKGVFGALLTADTWHVATGPAPTEDWTEPKEIWSLKPHVTRR